MGLYTESYMGAVRKFKEATQTQSEAYENFRKSVFDESTFDKKTQELIALSAACAIQCHYCVDAHGKKAKRFGASDKEIATAIHIATVIKAGATQGYGVPAFEE